MTAINNVQEISRKWKSLPVTLDMENHLIWEDIEGEAAREEERKNKFFTEWKALMIDTYTMLNNAFLHCVSC